MIGRDYTPGPSMRDMSLPLGQPQRSLIRKLAGSSHRILRLIAPLADLNNAMIRTPREDFACIG
jgi:hypothetical protein